MRSLKTNEMPEIEKDLLDLIKYAEKEIAEWQAFVKLVRAKLKKLNKRGSR